MIANAGLARSIRPIHGIGDGDTVFGLAMTSPAHTLTNAELGAIFNAGAQSGRRRVLRSTYYV